MGNTLRLALHDAGLALPPATFVGALAVGLLASLSRRWLPEPRIALTVPGVIMMVPGLYAIETVVQCNEGEILAALRSAVLVVFIVGANGDGAGGGAFSQPAGMAQRIGATHTLPERLLARCTHSPGSSRRQSAIPSWAAAAIA
jgi:hypothetical protein